jgi:hypothetical protein
MKETDYTSNWGTSNVEITRAVCLGNLQLFRVGGQDDWDPEREQYATRGHSESDHKI